MCLGENVIVPAFIAAEFAEHTPPPQLREVRGPWLEKAASHSPVSSEQRAPEEPSTEQECHLSCTSHCCRQCFWGSPGQWVMAAVLHPL